MASLAPFLPQHLARSLAKNGAPVRLPHVEKLLAALLHSDITGFTALTERLQTRGREGAEEIVRIVNAAFATAIAAIEEHGGSIVTFGGDALFSLFEGPGCATRACQAAREIRDQFAARGPIPTFAGVVSLGLAQVVHYGTVVGIHLGGPGQRTYIVAGRAVGTLARMEERTRTGDILTSRAAAAQRRREENGRRSRKGNVPRPTGVALDYVAPHVRGARLPFEGEFRRVTIMFLETRGLAPRLLQAFLLGLKDVLHRYEGTLISPDLCAAGVRWLCAFGAPVAHEDDNDRAARAAVELLRRCPRGMALRGGIHAGTAAYIHIGIASRASLELMGDVTNTAARAMAQAAWGEVLVTEETRKLLAGVDSEPRGTHAVKGKSAVLELHALKAAHAAAKQIRVSAPMIGRDAELRQIVSALERAREGTGSVIGIKGEPGLGKSRLKFEAANVARAMGFEVHEGRAISFEGMAYRTIGALLKDALSLSEFPEKKDVLGKVTEAAARLGMMPVDRHHLGDVLGARYPGSPIEHLQPKDVRLNAMIAIRTFCHALARQKPRLYVLEDMHWADGASAEAAEWLTAGAADAPHVVLLLYRPGYEPPKGAAQIELRDLGDDAVEKLLAAHLGVVPGTVAKLVRDRAGGNPFYVEEVVRHLLEVGILTRTDGGYQIVREVRPEDLPDSIERLIAARLDRLSPDVRRVAQYAAVIGRSFLFELLANLPQVASTAGPAVLELCRRELTFEMRRLPHLEYVFKHALTRDVAYSSILTAHRRKLHAEVADVLEKVLSAEREAFVPMLGTHREMAGDRASARECYLHGARGAVARHAFDEAEALYRGHLRLVDRPTKESIQARNDLAQEILQLRGRMAEAEAEHQSALEEARALGDERSAWASLRGLGMCCWRTGRMEEARALTEQALAIARKLGERRFEGIALGNLGILHKEQGRADQARDSFEQALAIHHAIGTGRSEGITLGNLASLHHDQGRIKEAQELYERALEIQRHEGQRSLEGWTLGNLAGVRFEQGRTAEARSLYQQALAMQRAVGDRGAEGWALGDLANLNLELGHMEEAAALYAQALAIHRDVGNRRGEGIELGNLAGLYLQKGRMDEAHTLLEESLAIHDEVGNRRQAGVELGKLASLRREQGRMDDARALHEQALVIHREVGNQRSEGIELGNMAGHELLVTGDTGRAATLARQGEALLGNLGDTLMRAKILCTRGHADLAEGRSAAEHLGHARVVADAAGALPESALGQSIEKLAHAQEALEGDRALVCGYAPEDLAAGQLAWLRAHRPEAIPR